MSSHIQQEGVLAFVESDAPPRHIAQECVLVFVVAESPRHIAQEGVLVFRENTPDDSSPPATWQASMAG